MKYCSKCGSANPEDAVFCAQCGTSMAQAPQAPEAPQPAPAPEAPAPTESVYNTNAGSYFTDNAAQPQPAQSGSVYSAAPAAAPAKNPNTLWLILNIVATLCCCLPAGVAGIVFAALGTGSFNKGDYADSDKKANIAKILFIVGAAVGLILNIVLLATGFFSAIANGDFGGYGY